MIKQMLSKLLDKTFLKFIVVGVINTLFGTAIMFAFYNILGLSYWLSSASNYFFGSILSYFLNKYYTFQNKEKGFGPVIRFIINITICYTVAYGVAKPIVGFMLQRSPITVRDNVAMIVGMGLFVCLNYCGQRFFAFKKGS